MIEKILAFLINVLLAVGLFTFGMAAFFIGMFGLVELLTAGNTWANTGNWPPLSVLQFLQRYSVPIPHTEMRGFQNLLDGWLAQSALVWVFFACVACASISNWLGDLMIPMTSKKASQPPAAKRYTDEELRRAIDKTVEAHRSRQKNG